MKVSYSKMILSGVIASTFLMVSCQKKGTASGVQPQTAEATDSNTNIDQKTPEEKNPQREQIKPLEPITPAEIKLSEPITPTADTTIIIRKPVVAVESSSDTTVVKKTEVKLETKDETKIETKDETKKTTEDSSNTKIEKELKPQTEACSEEFIKGDEKVQSSFKTTYAIYKNKSAAVKEKITALSDTTKECDTWEMFVVKQKNDSCMMKNSEANLKVTNQKWDKYCNAAGIVLRSLSGQSNKYASRSDELSNKALISLKAEKLIVSEDAKPLFEKENQAWKMFIVDGSVQSDSIKLTEALKLKKVVCTIAALPEKYSDATKVTLNIIGATEYKSKDGAKNIQSGINFKAVVETQLDKEDIIKSKAILACSNLSLKNLNVKKLKETLGLLIASEIK